MSLPSESVFKCAGHSSSENDRLIVDYGNEDHLYLSTIEHGEGRADVILSKDQVKSLRDQLTAWLGDGSDSAKLIDLLQRVYDMDLADRHLQPFNRSKLMDEIELVLESNP